MENPELNLLLAKNQLFFQWSETSNTWRLSRERTGGNNALGQQNEPALNLDAAQKAAIKALLRIHLLDRYEYTETPELDSLLNKYRLTFNWGNPGLRWWLVGQNKGSNALRRTIPQPAKDIETAKADAVQYILKQYVNTEEETKG